MWHNRPVLTSVMEFGRKAQKWDQLDPNLKSFATRHRRAVRHDVGDRVPGVLQRQHVGRATTPSPVPRRTRCAIPVSCPSTPPVVLEVETWATPVTP
jgi:hypothetical protein